jgi:hypothetical protein
MTQALWIQPSGQNSNMDIQLIIPTKLQRKQNQQLSPKLLLKRHLFAAATTMPLQSEKERILAFLESQ